MTNKMEARVLTYELGSPNYGDSNLAKWKIKIKKTGFNSSSLVYGELISWMRRRMVHFQPELMVSKMVV